MTCATCGRENPPHLTFCQECGQRLGPRIAPPTPPIGLGGQDAYGAAPVVTSPAAAPMLAATTPSLADRSSPRAAASPGLGLDATPAAPAVSGSSRRCKICDTANGPNLRYCTSCGSTLEAGPSVDPAPKAQAVAASRVVDVAPVATPEPGRVCPRCRGIADGNAQFCKFCGNSLGAPTNGVAHERESAGPEEARAVAHARGPTAAMNASAPQAAMPRPAAPAPSAGIAGSAKNQQGLLREPSAGAGVPAGVPRPASMPPAAPAPAAAPAPSRAPAAGATQRGKLVVIAKSGADGPSYPFGDLLDIGRSEGSVIVGEDPYLSPRHVRILWTGGKLVLRDLASTNGVFLRLAPSRDTTPRRSSDNPEVAVPLLDQDLILVGQQVLRFDILKESEAGLGPAQEHGTLLFGSPAAPRYARLCQRTVEGIARDVYYVRKAETVLGRESGDVVFTEDPFLSRRHAAIRLLSRDGGPHSASTAKVPPGDARFALVDLGSSNGTFLRIRGDVELAPGDHFRVGQQLFRVDFEGHAQQRDGRG